MHRKDRWTNASLFLLTAGRDALIVVWVNKLFDGDTDSTFKAAQTADKVIGHTLKVLLFVGLSFIKLGIGSAIAIIVRNLRTTGRIALDNYGVPTLRRILGSWMMFGMALILFAIGRFFATTVSFAQARRMIIEEGTEAIAEAVTAKRGLGVRV